MLRSEYRLLARPVGRVTRDQRFGFSILGRFKGACHDTLSNNFPEYSSIYILVGTFGRVGHSNCM